MEVAKALWVITNHAQQTQIALQTFALQGCALAHNFMALVHHSRPITNAILSWDSNVKVISFSAC